MRACPSESKAPPLISASMVLLLQTTASTLRRKSAKSANSPFSARLATIEVMFFPATYAQVALTITEDAVVSIKGRTDNRDDTVKLIASDISILNTDVEEGSRGPVVVTMAPARCTPPMVDRLRDVLATHPGATEVHLKLVTGSKEHLLRLGDGYRVKPSAALMGDLKALLGPSAISA